MPTALIRGVNIVYEVLGDRGPWVALITGGRRGHEEFVPLGQKLADQGFRVLLHDRRNTGASDVVIEGSESEEEIWTDDLYELFKQLGGLPVLPMGGADKGEKREAAGGQDLRGFHRGRSGCSDKFLLP